MGRWGAGDENHSLSSWLPSRGVAYEPQLGQFPQSGWSWSQSDPRFLPIRCRLTQLEGILRRRRESDTQRESVKTVFFVASSASCYHPIFSNYLHLPYLRSPRILTHMTQSNFLSFTGAWRPPWQKGGMNKLYCDERILSVYKNTSPVHVFSHAMSMERGL